MQWRRLVLWGVIASVIVATIGYYDIWHISPDVTGRFGYAVERHGKLPSFLASFYTAVGLFIAHSLVLAGSGDRRWIAPYPAYFETAWKFIVQLKFAFLFVGVLWLVLWLGASLFMLLKLDFLQELLKKSWFSVPVSVFAFASALHLTDVRPGIVRGIRTLLLVLLSWLLPLATLIVFGFMASLPWTGLTPLWATRHATAVLLGAAAVLVVLINTAFQNGEVASQLARVLRWSGRLAALLLAPIVLIGIYSLGLRVGDYGWTSDRVFAAACLLVAACYAGGYAWAALSRGPWLGRVASTNVVTAFLILIVLLSLFSPIADPARVSVASQLNRLTSGKVAAAKFDYDYLRFEGERYGWNALRMLKDYQQGADAKLIRERSAETLAKHNQWEKERPVASPNDLATNIAVWPKGMSLPDSLLNQKFDPKKQRWTIPDCLLFADRKCDAYLIDVDGDGKQEVLFLAAYAYNNNVVMMEKSGSGWEIAGNLPSLAGRCGQEIRQRLATGDYRLAPPLIQDIEVGGHRLQITPRRIDGSECSH